MLRGSCQADGWAHTAGAGQAGVLTVGQQKGQPPEAATRSCLVASLRSRYRNRATHTASPAHLTHSSAVSSCWPAPPVHVRACVCVHVCVWWRGECVCVFTHAHWQCQRTPVGGTGCQPHTDRASQPAHSAPGWVALGVPHTCQSRLLLSSCCLVKARRLKIVITLI